jgi:DNA polymerase V
LGYCNLCDKKIVMFALVDCNNFYASCERLFRPDLRDKPLVVLSNNDGCVIARSNEAKKLKIPMGAPAFKFQKLLEKNQVHVFSSNYALYGDMSNRVMNLLAQFAPEVEIYSIDEAFLDLRGLKNPNLSNYAARIQYEIQNSTGIPISIGIAPTKALAKVANKIAKKYSDRTKGIYLIDSDKKREKALKWLPIGDVWGLGRQHTSKLKKYGISNAYEFTQQHNAWIKKNFSVVELRLKRDLEGKETLPIEEIKDKKNIATTRSFDQPIDSFDKLYERLCTFTAIAAEKLRSQMSDCNSILVFVHTNGFRKDLPQYNRNILMQLPYPTSSNIELSKFVLKALKLIYKKNYKYKKAGIVLMDFSPQNQQQLNLFENANSKHNSLMKTMDELNKRLGTQKIKLATQNLNYTWKMKQEHLSPRYTTQLEEILKIKI